MIACRFYQEPCNGPGSLRFILCDDDCQGPVDRQTIKQKPRKEFTMSTSTRKYNDARNKGAASKRRK